MKSLKVVLASLVLTIGAMTMLSFTESYDSKAFTVQCYKFTLLQPNDRVIKGSADQIQQVSFTATGNWTLLTQSPSAVCDPTNFICAICFDDAQYTLQQALDIAWSTFNSLPNGQALVHGQDVDPSSNTITVYKRNFDSVPD